MGDGGEILKAGHWAGADVPRSTHLRGADTDPGPNPFRFQDDIAQLHSKSQTLSRRFNLLRQLKTCLPLERPVDEDSSVVCKVRGSDDDQGRLDVGIWLSETSNGGPESGILNFVNLTLRNEDGRAKINESIIILQEVQA